MSDDDLRCGWTRAREALSAAHRANARACRHVELMRDKSPAARRDALDAAYAKFERTKHAYIQAYDRLQWYALQLAAKGTRSYECPKSIIPGCMSCGRFLTMGQTRSSAEGDGLKDNEEECGNQSQAPTADKASSGEGMKLLDLEGHHDGSVTANIIS